MTQCIDAFLIDEIREMEVHKWIESEKAKRDLGEEALQDWVIKYAAKYRQEWNEKHGVCSPSCSGSEAECSK